MKLLITGANGQLGQALIAACDAHQISYIATSRADFDLCQLNKISDQLALHRPDIVVNAAAYTAVDKAETDVSEAFRINEMGAKNLATACKLFDIPLIHISTDYVFAGDATTPYLPSAGCDPKTVYGASKLAGERAIAAILPAHLIIRTAWLFSEYANNFAKTMLRLANERDRISVVADQIGCPTYAPDLAEVILAVAAKMLENKWQHYGVYQYTGAEIMSWHEFAKRIMTVRAQHLAKTPQVIAITSDQYPTAATRPIYSVLDGQSLWSDFALEPIVTPLDIAIARLLSS